MRLFFFTSIAVLVIACQPTGNSSVDEESLAAYQTPAHHSESLTKVFEAHGGFELWSKMNSLSYLKEDESTIVNLQNRKIRVETDEKIIGFDGNEVWITPDSVNASRARFYHNLYFYFYAMPFVVGDPGANYEDVGTRGIKGKTYNGIKVSYKEGVGDASDDNYILWVDPKTNLMKWLMYTVTYRSREPSDNFRLIGYEEWSTFNGLVLPTKLQWYNYKNDSVGEARGEPVLFEDIKIKERFPPDSLFMMPNNAIIAPR